MNAGAGDLNASLDDTKTGPLGLISYGGLDFFVIQFNGLATTFTDKKLRCMLESRMFAANKGIQCIEAMNQAVFQEKIEGTIDSRGRCLVSILGELVQ
jgi:hypothetical protein